MTDLPSADLLTSAVLADTLDALGHRCSALPHTVRPLKSGWKICGRAATLQMAAIDSEPVYPYAVEMECLDALRPGEVLVASTGADVSSALWGELLSTAARARGAVGAVTDGLTRDCARILAMDFPVFAAGFSPLDSKGRLDGVAHGVPINLGGCTVRPGDWVFGDVDGVVVVPAEMAEQTFARALDKVRGENTVRAELARGRSLREVFAEHRIL